MKARQRQTPAARKKQPRPKTAHSATANSLCELVFNNLNANPDKVLLHAVAAAGAVTSYTGQETLKLIEQSRQALLSLGLQRNQYVGMMMGASPHWIFFEQAILSIGAISIGIFEKTNYATLKQLMRDTALSFIFVDSEECAQLLTGFQKKFKYVFIQDDLFAQFHENKNFKHTQLLSWSQLLELAVNPQANKPSAVVPLAKAMTSIKGERTAAIFYTSGTYGPPKGVLTTHRSLVFQIMQLNKYFKMEQTSDRSLSILPIAHVLERLSVYYYLTNNIANYFLADIKNIYNALRRFKPTVLVVVPRVLERFYERIQKTIVKTPQPLRLFYQKLLAAVETHDPELPLNWRVQLYRFIYKRTILKAFGGKLKFFISSGARLDPKLLRVYVAGGTPIYSAYGASETTGAISINSKQHLKYYSAGHVLEDVHIKIGANHEIFVSSPALMKGYVNDVKATQKVISHDKHKRSWFATGDKGRLTDGFIFLEGRLKDLFKTSTGHFVNPSPIEAHLCNHHQVSYALIVGETRKMVCALLFINPLTMDKNQRNFEELMHRQMQRLIIQVNADLPDWEKIKRFRIIWEMPSFVRNELSLKLDLRRGALEQKYKAEIDAMYD